MNNTKLVPYYHANNPQPSTLRQDEEIAQYRGCVICGVGTGKVGNWSRTYRSFPACIRVRRISDLNRGNATFHDVRTSLGRDQKFSQKQLKDAIDTALAA